MMNFFGTGKSSSAAIVCNISEDDDSWDSEKDYTIDSKTCTSNSSTIVSVVCDSSSNYNSTFASTPSSIICRKESILKQGGRHGKDENSSKGISKVSKSHGKDENLNKGSSEVSKSVEVNYDTDCTQLFGLIQDKNWEAAADTAKADPKQIQTWVYRKQPDSPDKLRWRLLPIHAMCVFVAPEGLMELLLDNFPKAASMRDDQEMLPIHLACRNGSTKGVVKLLLDAYPEGFYAKDRKGRTPSDFARASSNFHKEGIIMTLERFQASLESQQKQKDGNIPPPPTIKKEGPQEVNYENRTALLKNIIKRNWEAVVNRTVQFPKEASVWTKTKGLNGDIRFLPIHKACVLNPPAEVIEALIAAYPESAKATDQDGWLPLHCASYYRAGEPILSFLIRTNLDACKAKDEEGRIPIHYACMKRLPCTVVQKMIDACPKSLKLKDDEGYTALHLACGHGCSPEVLEILVSEYSKSAQSRDDQGRLPLHHLCCNSEVSEDDAESIVRMLLKAFKSAVTIQDDQGKLPMHYACENKNIGEAALSLLYAAFPKAIEVKDGYGYTPITASQAFGNDMDMILFSFSEEGNGNQENCKEPQNPSKYDTNSPRKQRNGACQPLISSGSSPWNTPSRSPLRQHSQKDNTGAIAEHVQGCKTNSTSPQKQTNNTVETEIVSRIRQMEDVLANFGEAMKTMQNKLEQGEDPRELLESLSLESKKGLFEAK